TGLCSDGRKKTWDPSTGQVLEDRVIVPGFDEVEFGHDGSFLVTGSDGGRLRAVDAASGKGMATLVHRASPIRALALPADSRRRFVGGPGRVGVEVFDPRRDPGGRIAPAQWQLCAMAFDERGETLRTINWELNGDGARLEIHDVAGGGP